MEQAVFPEPQIELERYDCSPGITDVFPAEVSAPTALGSARQDDTLEFVTSPTRPDAQPAERPVTSEGSSCAEAVPASASTAAPTNVVMIRILGEVERQKRFWVDKDVGQESEEVGKRQGSAGRQTRVYIDVCMLVCSLGIKNGRQLYATLVSGQGWCQRKRTSTDAKAATSGACSPQDSRLKHQDARSDDLACQSTGTVGHVCV